MFPHHPYVSKIDSYTPSGVPNPLEDPGVPGHKDPNAQRGKGNPRGIHEIPPLVSCDQRGADTTRTFVIEYDLHCGSHGNSLGAYRPVGLGFIGTGGVLTRYRSDERRLCINRHLV